MAISQSDIEDQSKTPRRMTTDEGTVQERDVKEMIEADRYGAAKAAASVSPWGLRVALIQPGSPGAANRNRV
jgi:hypothetical protein